MGHLNVKWRMDPDTVGEGALHRHSNKLCCILLLRVSNEVNGCESKYWDPVVCKELKAWRHQNVYGWSRPTTGGGSAHHITVGWFLFYMWGIWGLGHKLGTIKHKCLCRDIFTDKCKPSLNAFCICTKEVTQNNSFYPNFRCQLFVFLLFTGEMGGVCVLGLGLGVWERRNFNCRNCH